ncbi:MAG: cell division protein FtsZ, partial [Alphaproteobacteria bacterium]
DQGILTVGVVTKPFQFEGQRRMRVADSGIEQLQECVDTLIVIPNQNLFRVANEKTTFADAFAMADQVLYSGVACITDLMVKEGLINLDFADVRSVMREMGKAMMGTGEASGDQRATQAAEAAIANPLLDETSMKGAQGLLISITGGNDLTLFEVDEAATRIREEVDPDANIILGATFEESLDGVIRVSVVATGIDTVGREHAPNEDQRIADMGARLREAAEHRPAVEQTLPQRPIETSKPAVATPAPAAPIPAAQPAAQRSAPTPMATPAAATATPSRPAMDPAPAPRPAPAPAAARQQQPADNGITIEPFEPGPIHHGPTEIDALAGPLAASDHPPADEPFVPPAAEAPAPRIPQVQDFPPIAQQQMAARRDADEGGDGQSDRGPMSLLRRLATVGLGRRDEEPLGGQNMAAKPAAIAARPQAASRPAPQSREAHPTSSPEQRHQPNPAQPRHGAAPRNEDRGALDDHGRQPARQPRPLDDELEIPAFLRRQAN